jgi:L-alanine-DL-glutamate epimerase-like enolase superfamily enzyme
MLCLPTIFTRRKALKRAAGAGLAAGLFKLTEPAADAQAQSSRPVNTNSAPSNLKITDMRAITIAANYDYPVIRIDTNQGVYGLGEVRDAGWAGNALILKAHLIGKNPLQIEGVLRSIRQFAGHGRMGGGYSAVDIALHDIAGKVQGVPAWKLAGEKKRDKIRVYADTTGVSDIKVFAKRLANRKKQGFTVIKMDLYTRLVADRPGAIGPGGAATEKGLQYLCEYIAAAKDAIGQDTPLAADHFGRLTVEDAIRYAKAFEPYKLAWAEDLIPWRNWRGLKRIKEASSTPVLSGEDIFGLEEGFFELIENEALDIIHPDPGTSGAIRETKRISDAAFKKGIRTAVHMAGGPVGCMAAVHMCATLQDLVAMENHAIDMPWWQDLVTGPAKPIVQNGFIPVPDTPGIGVELNEEVVKKHLRYPGYFEPTPMYDNYVIRGYHTGGPWPHYDDDGNWCDNCISYQ